MIHGESEPPAVAVVDRSFMDVIQVRSGNNSRRLEVGYWPPVLLVALTAVALLAGCSAIARTGSSGVVVSHRAQIRSSTAVVAADLLEVSRNDHVDILDSLDVPDPSDNTKKELWYRVRAHDHDATEGWIEARNIMLQDVVEKSQKLAAEDKDVQAQATGQLHASSNLRLSPDRTKDDNIMMRLDSGASFEIVGWKRVPKVKDDAPDESDIAPKPGSATSTRRSRSDRSEEEDQEVKETTELWYKVRLAPAISPAPAGWIFGKQVELTVPSDIIYYRTGREFVAWRRLDEETSDESSATQTKDVAHTSRPGSWVILEKSNPKDEPHKMGEPDFDRIYVLGYEKHDQDHYTAYRSPDVEGYLPLRVEGKGANKSFTVRIKEDSGQVKDMTFSLYRDEHGVMRVTPPEPIKSKRR
jgi:hypothetical protein